MYIYLYQQHYRKRESLKRTCMLMEAASECRGEIDPTLELVTGKCFQGCFMPEDDSKMK